MRVGIDGGCWSNRRGYGRFLREILTAIGRIDREHDYLVFLDPPSYKDFHLGPPFLPVRVALSRAITEAASADGSRSLADLYRMSRAVSCETLDVFFFPSVYSYFPLLQRVPVLLAIHDAIPERNPAMHFDSPKQALLWRAKVLTAVAQASMVLTVSEYSKRSLIDLLRISENQVRVLYEAASSVFRKIETAEPTRRYILYVGGFSPHKNLATLVRAFARLKARASGVRLKLAGDYASDPFKGSYAELRDLVSALGLENEVEFTGYLPDAELCHLYNGASLVALPSFDEGFGLPALEAMSCGVPVVASSGTAVEEVAGSAAVFISPHDEVGFASAMDRLLGDRDLAFELSELGRKRAAEFSWDRTAVGLTNLLREIALPFK